MTLGNVGLHAVGQGVQLQSQLLCVIFQAVTYISSYKAFTWRTSWRRATLLTPDLGHSPCTAVIEEIYSLELRIADWSCSHTQLYSYPRYLHLEVYFLRHFQRHLCQNLLTVGGEGKETQGHFFSILNSVFSVFPLLAFSPLPLLRLAGP